MKYIVLDKRKEYLAKLNYIILPGIGWLIYEVPGIIIGFLLTYFWAGVTLQWAVEIVWQDVDQAIDTLCLKGGNDDRVYMTVKNYPINLFKLTTKAEGTRYGT